MPVTFSPKVNDLGRRSGVPNKLKDVRTNHPTLVAVARICKVYSTILEDVQRLDPKFSQPESKAIFRIVDEVQQKLLHKVLEKVRRSCNGPRGNSTERDDRSSDPCGWLEQEEQQLFELQETLSRHKQRFRGTPLSRATPIELLCRLVGIISGNPGWDIDNYVDHFRDLKISRLLASAYHRGESYWGCGLPAKLFICIGPHGGGVHVIASSADHFDGLDGLGYWANDAHKLRKTQPKDQKEQKKHLEQLQGRVNRFYKESTAFEGDEVALWNFIHRWKITNTLQPSAASTTHTHFDETAAALDVTHGLVVCAGCFKCQAVHTYKLSGQSITAECDFRKSLSNPKHYPSCSCCEDLGSLFCLNTRSTAGQISNNC